MLHRNLFLDNRSSPEINYQPTEDTRQYPEKREQVMFWKLSAVSCVVFILTYPTDENTYPNTPYTHYDKCGSGITHDRNRKLDE